MSERIGPTDAQVAAFHTVVPKADPLQTRALEMIAPTEKDIGRRVRLATIPDTIGTLEAPLCCDLCNGCLVLYEGKKFPWSTDPEKLQWADESLL